MAYDSLRKKNKDYQELKINIEPTHLYIRFKPENELELNTLEADSTIELYSYPLDREIPEGLTSYHDPSIDKSKPTFQYTVVPYNYTFPHDIKVKVLESLFIPESEPSLLQRTRLDFTFDLEKEAFSLTNNNFDREKPNKESSARSIYPSGNLFVSDDIVGSTTITTTEFSHYICVDCETQIEVDCNSNLDPVLFGKTNRDSNSTVNQKPVEENCQKAIYKTVTKTVANLPLVGAKVRARRWFTTKTAITDNKGYFRVNYSFGGEVNYEIIWERSHWDIRDGNLTQAFLNGPKQSSPWNLTINFGKSLRYATIHRACYRYFYDNIGGLKRPNVWTRLKINYNDGEGTGINWGTNWQGFLGSGSSLFLPNIKI